MEHVVAILTSSILSKRFKDGPKAVLVYKQHSVHLDNVLCPNCKIVTFLSRLKTFFLSESGFSAFKKIETFDFDVIMPDTKSRPI